MKRVTYAKLGKGVVGKELIAVSHEGETPGRVEYDFGNSLGTITACLVRHAPVEDPERPGHQLRREVGKTPKGFPITEAVYDTKKPVAKVIQTGVNGEAGHLEYGVGLGGWIEVE